MRALGRGGSGPRLLAWSAFKFRHGLGGLCPFSVLNELWGPVGPYGAWRQGVSGTGALWSPNPRFVPQGPLGSAPLGPT